MVMTVINHSAAGGVDYKHTAAAATTYTQFTPTEMQQVHLLICYNLADNAVSSITTTARK